MKKTKNLILIASTYAKTGILLDFSLMIKEVRKF
jgi:hypothetical protein